MPIQLFYFISGFLIVLTAFIAFIVGVSTRFSPFISLRLYGRVERVILGGILLGLVGMFQPWFLPAFRLGFLVLLFSTLAFIVWTHVRPQRTDETAGRQPEER